MSDRHSQVAQLGCWLESCTEGRHLFPSVIVHVRLVMLASGFHGRCSGFSTAAF